VLEKAGTAKNYKYKTGDKIHLETLRDNLIFSGAAITAGVFYISLDALNGIINNDSPVIAESTLIATGALIGSGFLMKQFVLRKIDLEDKWRLKILDFSFPAD
jgi:hypothetical protein